MQDWKEDLEIESTTMCGIYGGSYCRLSALGSFNGDGGLFRKGPISFLSTTLKTQFDDFENETWHLYQPYHVGVERPPQPLLHEDGLSRNSLVEYRVP